MKKPNKWHIREAVITAREGLNKFEISLEMRELMKIYRILKKRNENKITEKIRKFLNSFAESCGFDDFNINDEISVRKITELNDDGD